MRMRAFKALELNEALVGRDESDSMSSPIHV